jgi:tetratricopeptide (TPR) repeat protein
VSFLGRVWRAIRGSRRPVTSADCFRLAEQSRRAGRLEDAASLITQGLALDPRSILGHLLAAYVHAALRQGEAAKREFATALVLDPRHPRALLGLARVALEEGDAARSAELLREALRFTPDFPEARALLEATGHAETPADARSGDAPALLGRLSLPLGSRQCVVRRTDGTVLFGHPDAAAADALGASVARLTRIASATLARAGLAAMESAVVDGSSGTMFVRGGDDLVVALTLGHEAPMGTGQRHVDAIWTRCRAEARPPRDEAGPGERRGS